MPFFCPLGGQSAFAPPSEGVHSIDTPLERIHPETTKRGRRLNSLRPLFCYRFVMSNPNSFRKTGILFYSSSLSAGVT